MNKQQQRPTSNQTIVPTGSNNELTTTETHLNQTIVPTGSNNELTTTEAHFESNYSSYL